MTRTWHTEEQILAVLKDAQAGAGVPELCRKHGISDATVYKWRAKYSGLEVNNVLGLRQPEDENRRLQQMVADQALDIQALNAINAKNWQGPRRSERRLRGSTERLCKLPRQGDTANGELRASRLVRYVAGGRPANAS